MKILQISPQIPYPPDSGGKISIWGITKYLSQLGHQITLVSYYDESYDVEKYNALKNYCEPIFIKHNTRNNILKAIVNLFSSVPYNISKYYCKSLENFLINFLNKNDIDIIHIDHLHLSWVIDVVKSIKNIPVVLREHNLELKIMKRFYEDTKNPFLKFYAGLQYKKFIHYEPLQALKFDKCIMISKEDEKYLKELNSKVKIRTIPVGVEENILNLKINSVLPLTLFHVGSLKWIPNREGLMWFLKEIFPIIISSYPQTKLYIYGIGAETIEVDQSLSDNVIKVGYVEDIWKEIKNKMVMIVPLIVGSGMRVKIIEMLAAGKLIVTTSVGKEGIEVTDGQQIFIADDSQSFAQRIIDIFSGKVNSDKVIMNAKRFIEQNHLWSHIAKEFENEYLDLINQYKNKAESFAP